jgi:hypothetical protein
MLSNAFMRPPFFGPDKTQTRTLASMPLGPGFQTVKGAGKPIGHRGATGAGDHHPHRRQRLAPA